MTVIRDIPPSFLKSPDFRKTGYLKSTDDYLQGIDFSKISDYSTKCYPGSDEKINEKIKREDGVTGLQDGKVVDFSSVNGVSSADASNKVSEAENHKSEVISQYNIANDKYNEAKTKYDQALNKTSPSDNSSGTNEATQTTDNSSLVNEAKAALDEAEKNLEKAKIELEKAGISEEEAKAAKEDNTTSLNNAANKYKELSSQQTSNSMGNVLDTGSAFGLNNNNNLNYLQSIFYGV